MNRVSCVNCKHRKIERILFFFTLDTVCTKRKYINYGTGEERTISCSIVNISGDCEKWEAKND